MKIPDTITVAGITYTVEEKEPDSVELDYGHLRGSQSSLKNLISISNSLNEQQKEQTFLHEVTHSILDALALSEQQVWIDERFVESFSQILFQVVQQLTD